MRRNLTSAFCLLIFLTACSPQTTAFTPEPVDLLPYLTATRATHPPPTVHWVAPETPLPTPTPFTYTVRQGETISSIALKFGVSMDDLIAANPEISPNIMPVGTVLKIPGNPINLSGEATPTPVPFIVEQAVCYPTASKGLWCFALARHDFPDLMENISAQVTLVDSHGGFLAAQTALLPLNILPPNTSLPLSVYFAPDIPVEAMPQVQMLTAIRLSLNDPRYLPATINNTLVQIDSDGHFAQVSGEVHLPAESNAATKTWVAAVAYDETGRVVGVRRWEGGGIQPGGKIRFEMTVASLGGVLRRVEFAVEARP
ncbi:MAG: LysM peptidoglycan-binding domain-containing protein [Chloroflexi bacterium]|nr:LysM peptidoglycan-binding domain-containing protein [Chloroflexota bacterium]